MGALLEGARVSDVRDFEKDYYEGMPGPVRSVVDTKNEGIDALYEGDIDGALLAFEQAESDMRAISNGITGTFEQWVKYRRESYGIAGPMAVAACLANDKEGACLGAMASLHSGPVQYIAYGAASIPAEFMWYNSGIYDQYQIYCAGWEALAAAYTGQLVFPTSIYRDDFRQKRAFDMSQALLDPDKVMFGNAGMSDRERISDATKLDILFIAGDIINGNWYSPAKRRELVRLVCEQAVSERFSFGQVEEVR